MAEELLSDADVGLLPEQAQSDNLLSDSDVGLPAILRPPSSALRRYVADPAIGLAKGIVGLPEAIVGLADIPTLGYAGKILEAGGYGFQPKFTKDYLSSFYSPEQKTANEAVQKAKGFFPTVRAMVENPSTIVQTVGESVPSMLGGAGVARKLISVAPKLAPLVAGAIGEGAVTAGQQAEQTRQDIESGLLTPKQAALSATSGAATGLIGVLGGGLAKRLGVTDIDTLMAGGSVSAQAAKKGILRRVVESAITEGALEELPQSAQEQIQQNFANNKPWNEGVAEAAATGLLAGLVMGGAGGLAVSQTRPAVLAPPNVTEVSNVENRESSPMGVPAGQPAESIPPNATGTSGEIQNPAATLPQGQRAEAQPGVVPIVPAPRILTPERTRELAALVKAQAPLPASEIDEFSLAIPPGYVRKGNEFVFTPIADEIDQLLALPNPTAEQLARIAEIKSQDQGKAQRAAWEAQMKADLDARKAASVQPAKDFATALAGIGAGGADAFFNHTKEQLERGERVTFTKPAAIAVARKDQRYILRDNADGTVDVVSVNALKETGAAPGTPTDAVVEQPAVVKPVAEPWQMRKAEGDKWIDANMINAVKTDKGRIIARNIEHGDLLPALEETGSTFKNPNARGWALVGRKPSESYIGIFDVNEAKGDFHKAYVMKALREGKTVPQSVLSDYSDLAASSLESAKISQSDAAIAKGGINGLPSNVEFFSRLFQSPAFTKSGLNSLEIPTQREVVARVIAALHQPEIFDSIIKLVPVDVVNNLVRRNASSDVIFHDKGVFSNMPSSDLKDAIAIPVNVADALARAVTRLAAKERSGATNAIRDALERSSAVGASELYHGKQIIPKGAEGKPEVLADYPDLKPVTQPETKPVATPTPATPVAETSGETKQPWQMTKAEWTRHQQRGTWADFEDAELGEARSKEKAAYSEVQGAEQGRKALGEIESVRKVMADREGALKRNQQRRDADKAIEAAQLEYRRASRRVSNAGNQEAFIKRAQERGKVIPPEVIADFPELELTPTAAPAQKPTATASDVAPKQSRKPTPLRELDELILKHGMELDLIRDLETLQAARITEKSGLGTMGLAAVRLQNAQRIQARERLAKDLKVDLSTPGGAAELLAKLKERIASTAKLVEVALSDMPEGSEFTVHGEKFTVKDTNPDTGIVTLKDGRTLKVNERASVKIDPGSLQTKEATFNPSKDLTLAQAESVEEQKVRLAKEESARQSEAQRKALEEKAAKPLVGSGGDIGQADLLGGGDLFSQPPTEAKPFGSQNKVVSTARADELRKRIQDKLKRTNIGVDPTIFSDAVQLGAYYIEGGYHKFSDWSAKMLADFGDAIKDHLRSIYETAKITIESPGGESPVGRAAGLQPGLRPPTERIVTARDEFTKPADETIIPSEITRHLDAHQRQGVAAALRSLIERGAFLLADGTGAGKTRQAIAVAHYYAKLGKKVVIVTKSETIKQDWDKKTFGGSYAFDSEAMGVKIKLARDGVVQPGEIGITTYQNLANLERASDKNTVIIFDESHALKNDSQQAKFGMRATAKADRVMFMSATPADKPEHIYYLAPIGVMEGKTIQQALRDLGMTLVSVNKMVKENNKWVKRLVTFWAEDQNVTDAERHARFSALFDRMTANGAALKREISMDGVHVQVLKLTLPPEAHETMVEILTFFDASSIDDLQGLKKALVLGHQRRQQEPFKIAPAVMLAKRELDAGRQVVIFVARVNESEVGKWVKVGTPGQGQERIRQVLMSSEGTVKTLFDALHEAGIHDIAEIHGNADQNSLEAMADFQAGRKRVVIATIESGGTGINLDDTLGNRPRSMIVVTAPFDAVGNVQAAGRIWRLKTLSGSRVFYLFGDTDVDQWNADIIGTKMSMLGAVVEGQVRRLNMSDPELVGTDDFHSTMRGQPQSQKPTPPQTSSAVPTLDWKPFKTKAGKDKFLAPATKEFWDWYNANGKSDNPLGLRPSKWQDNWQVWSDSIPTQPTPPETGGTPESNIAERAIAGIEDLQKKIRGTGSDVSMGVPKAILDLALEVARLSLKAGNTIYQAIDAAIAKIREQLGDTPFDEAQVRASLNGELAPGDAREEEVSKEVRGSIIDPATGEWVEDADTEAASDIVQIAGIEYNIVAKERLTPEQKSAADTRAREYFQSLNLPGEADLSEGKQRGATDTNLVFTLTADGENHDEAGEALLAHLTEQIQSQHQPGGNPAYVSSLVNFLNKNFNVGNFNGVFSDGMIQRLMEISVGESSWRGSMLRAITGITEDMGTVARNAKFFLRRTYENMFGGDLTRKLMDRIALNFRERFTGEEIERLYNENPVLQELFLKVVGRLKVKPSLRDVIAEIFATPINKQDDIVERFVDTMVNKFSATPSEAARLKSEFSRTFEASFNAARKKAQEKALATLLPEERKVIGPQTQLWKKLTDLVNSGWFDSAKVVEEYARSKGMKIPTEAEIKQMRDWSIREQELRKPTAEEKALYGDQANILVEGTTLEKRQELLRKMNTQWSRWTHPVVRGWRDLADPVKRYNSAMAANEWLTANLLLKLGFGSRQIIDVGTQMVLHTPTRAAQYAFEQWGNDKSAGRDTNLLGNLSQAMTDAYRTRIKVLGDTLASFKRTLAGRGEQKNVEQLISSIAVFDRALLVADEMKASKPAAARFLHLLALTMRFGRQFAAAADVIQGVPAEAQEMAHQIRTGLREQGKSPGQQELEFNTILGLLTTARTESLAQARQLLESRGLDLTNASIQRAAWHILREKIYNMAKTAGLPADEWKIQNHYYRNVIGWNEPETQGFGGIGGPGGAVAMTAKVGKELFSKAGLPAFPFVFGNAMGISLNRKLAYTPLGLFPGFFKGSPWFEGERNIRQRKIEAVIGTTIGSTLMTLAALGIFVVLPRKWPDDEKEKAKWTANGWQPGMVIIPVSDTQEMKISTRVGPMSLVSPWLAAGGAFRDAAVQQAKRQEELNERAAKLGLTPEKLEGLDPGQWLNVIGSAAYASAVGGRTSSGMLGSYTDFGQFSAKKSGAAATSTLIPGLPGFQEISRMAGSNINPKLASFWDLLVPLPTSDANRVNMLGDPMRNENDIERIFQILSGGTSPFPADKDQFNKNKAYTNLFTSDFRPPSINPARGYQFGDEFRAMKDAELQKYTALRGKHLSEELQKLDLTGMTPEAAKKAAGSAFRRANTAALTEVGAVAPRVSTRSTISTPSSTAAPVGLSMPSRRTSRTRRYGLSAIRPIRLSTRSRGRTRRLSTRRSRVRSPRLSVRRAPRGTRRISIARIRRPSIASFV